MNWLKSNEYINVSEMKTIINASIIFGIIGSIGTQLLPEIILQESVKFIFTYAFSGGVFTSAGLFLFIEKAKGNTKTLLMDASLTDSERLRLSKAIKRRSAFLWKIYIKALGVIALGWILNYLNGKGIFQPYSLYVSFVITCMIIPFIFLVFMVWRDYIKAKELLDNKNVKISDLE